MRILTDKNETHIILDEDEDERQVLRAIVKASFELASPAGLSMLDYKPDYKLSDTEADKWIRPAPRSHDSCIVDMDFVQGRQCKTVLSKEAHNHFALYTKYFERFRGNPKSMLDHAKHLLSDYQPTRYNLA